MGKWKKVIAVSIVLLLAVSAASVYVLYQLGFFGSNYGDMDGYYFDLEGASSVGICNVESGEMDIGNAQMLNIASLAVCSIEQAGSAFSQDHRPVSHDSYLVAPSRVHSQLKNVQSKLFIEDDHGNKKIAKAYLNSSDMKDKKEHVNYKQSIVYVADAGKFILISYYKHNLSDVYNHLNYHGSFWSGDKDYASALIDKSTGLVHKLSGLWCGCTYGKYSGTNDVMPSIQYVGQIKGEEAFLINLDRNLEINNNNPGMFHDKRGLITIDIVDDQIVYKELITERNAGVGINTDDDGNPITVWDEGSPILGPVFEFYKNGIVHFTEYYGFTFQNGGSGSQGPNTFHVKHYLWFAETGERRAVNLDEIIDVDGYLCSEAVYENTYFPKQCNRYMSDGSTEVVMFSDAESYRVASEQKSPYCIYREIGTEQSVLYMYAVIHEPYQLFSGVFNRVTLSKDLTFTLEQDIFKEPMTQNIRPDLKGFIEYDHRLFWKLFPDQRNVVFISENLANVYTGLIIQDDNLYAIDDENGVLYIYNLTTGSKTTKSFSEINDLLYMYVDYNGVFTIEGSSDDGYLRGTLQDDGSFKFKKADLELDVVKKVKTKNN